MIFWWFSYEKSPFSYGSPSSTDPFPLRKTQRSSAKFTKALTSCPAAWRCSGTTCGDAWTGALVAFHFFWGGDHHGKSLGKPILFAVFWYDDSHFLRESSHMLLDELAASSLVKYLLETEREQVYATASGSNPWFIIMRPIKMGIWAMLCRAFSAWR